MVTLDKQVLAALNSSATRLRYCRESIVCSFLSSHLRIERNTADDRKKTSEAITGSVGLFKCCRGPEFNLCVSD